MKFFLDKDKKSRNYVTTGAGWVAETYISLITASPNLAFADVCGAIIDQKTRTSASNTERKDQYHNLESLIMQASNIQSLHQLTIAILLAESTVFKDQYSSKKSLFDRLIQDEFQKKGLPQHQQL